MTDITNLRGGIIAGFKLLRLLGRGGNGVVYLARQLTVDRITACKILHPELTDDPVYIKNFVHEARLAARLEHPNIIQALDVGSSDGLHYLIMEYVPGTSLEKIRTSSPDRITMSFLLDISIALADALDYAWKKFHIFHGDIKPDNLLIHEQNSCLKLADLGLAKIVGKDDLATDIMATPLYAAPEIICAEAEKIGMKSDIYSFGIMLYELIAGKAPFRGSVESVLQQHVTVLPPPLEKIVPDINRNLTAYIGRMIEKSPEKRPADWAEIKSELQNIRKKIPDNTAIMRPAFQSEEHKKTDKKAAGKKFFAILWSIILLLLAATAVFAVFKYL